jgi:hypothetical protein
MRGAECEIYFEKLTDLEQEVIIDLFVSILERKRVEKKGEEQ